jgi:glycosyltransferase involved in cell wall biosynthesis
MIVVYYTSTYFLDISLDIINVLKKQVELHVFIEVTNASKNVNLANIKSLPKGEKLITPAALLNAENYAALQPYFEGAAGVHFVIHDHPTGFSFDTLSASRAVYRQVRHLKPEIIHFEGYTLRTIGLLPYLFYFKKVFLTIHDPIPHSGEKSWKIRMPNFLFFHLPFKKYFVFYSKFAQQLFVNHYTRIKQEQLVIEMCAYSYYKRPVNRVGDNGSILFFGRVSPYKGIQILLDAMPIVSAEFPGQQLVIAGEAAKELEWHRAVNTNIQIINRHIPDEELIGLINNAKFIVCPYLDATQSGVLMTAFALNKPVIASNVGSFPEFIHNGINGLLVPPGDSSRLAEVILAMLHRDQYKKLVKGVALFNKEHTWDNSLIILLNAYAC